jgi:single-stranded-DNA-specific exonuclease recJ
MIQIFQELGFVQIENGIMTVNKDAEKKEIASSSIYQDLVQTVKDQELMALGSVQEIYDYLTESI